MTATWGRCKICATSGKVPLWSPVHHTLKSGCTIYMETKGVVEPLKPSSIVLIAHEISLVFLSRTARLQPQTGSARAWIIELYIYICSKELGTCDLELYKNPLEVRYPLPGRLWAVASLPWGRASVPCAKQQDMAETDGGVANAPQSKSLSRTEMVKWFRSVHTHASFTPVLPCHTDLMYVK